MHLDTWRCSSSWPPQSSTESVCNGFNTSNFLLVYSEVKFVYPHWNLQCQSLLLGDCAISEPLNQASLLSGITSLEGWKTGTLSLPVLRSSLVSKELRTLSHCLWRHSVCSLPTVKTQHWSSSVFTNRWETLQSQSYTSNCTGFSPWKMDLRNVHVILPDAIELYA